MRGFSMKGGEIDKPAEAKLFCGLIYTQCLDLETVLEKLEQEWGQIEFISERINFAHTRYYEKEMGNPLFRKFLTFAQPVKQEFLLHLKWTARKVEMEFLSPKGGRCVNIDPGLLLPDKLVLATTKPCAHRPYLGKGIYAEVTLTYENGGYRRLPWTYPDFASSEILMMFDRLRDRHRMEARWKESYR